MGFLGHRLCVFYILIHITRFFYKKTWPIILFFFIWFVMLLSSLKHSLWSYWHSRPIFIDTYYVKVFTCSVLKLRINNLLKVIQLISCWSKIWIQVSWTPPWADSSAVGVWSFIKNGFIANCGGLWIPGYGKWILSFQHQAATWRFPSRGWCDDSCDLDSRKLMLS